MSYDPKQFMNRTNVGATVWQLISKICNGSWDVDHDFNRTEAHERTIARILSQHEKDLHDLNKRVSELEISEKMK